jgi:hypothetical protein
VIQPPEAVARAGATTDSIRRRPAWASLSVGMPGILPRQPGKLECKRQSGALIANEQCGALIDPGCSRRSVEQILLFESLLHYVHPPGRILARQCERDVGRTIEPRIEFLFARQQDDTVVVTEFGSGFLAGVHSGDSSATRVMGCPLGEVVNFSREDDPAVVSGVVQGDLFARDGACTLGGSSAGRPADVRVARSVSGPASETRHNSRLMHRSKESLYRRSGRPCASERTRRMRPAPRGNPSVN